MVTIAMFNNKGGVGKTTLTNNIASYISEKFQKRVLVVDCDPQCNSTQLLMGQEFATELYWGEGSSTCTTISDILQPIEDGDSAIHSTVVPIKSSETKFNVDLIPGNPKFSMIEDRLGAAWHESKGGDIGGIRKTNWNRFLIERLSAHYDYVFYDLGPSLGSINRSVMIACDYFITPMGTDIFSILGIKNISEWLGGWIATYENSLKVCEDSMPGRLASYGISRDVKIKRGYLGYTIQQYITKSKQGIRRPTKAYEEIINNVPTTVYHALGAFKRDVLTQTDLKLGDVPHLYSLIPLAQSNSAPILKLKGGDGLVGSQFKQQQDFSMILSGVVSKIFSNLETASR